MCEEVLSGELKLAEFVLVPPDCVGTGWSVFSLFGGLPGFFRGRAAFPRGFCEFWEEDEEYKNTFTIIFKFKLGIQL